MNKTWVYTHPVRTSDMLFTPRVQILETRTMSGGVVEAIPVDLSFVSLLIPAGKQLRLWIADLQLHISIEDQNAD